MDAKSSQRGKPRKRKCDPQREHLRHQCPVTGCSASVLNLQNHYSSCHKSGDNSIPLQEWHQLYAEHIKIRKHGLEERKRLRTDVFQGLCNSSVLDNATVLLRFTTWMSKPTGGKLSDSTVKFYTDIVTDLINRISEAHQSIKCFTKMMNHFKTDLPGMLESMLSKYSPKYLCNCISATKKFITFCDQEKLIVKDISMLESKLCSLYRHFKQINDKERFSSQNVAKRLNSAIDPKVVALSLNYMKDIGFTEENIMKFKADGLTASRQSLTSLYCTLRDILMFQLISTNGKRGVEITNMTLDEFDQRVTFGNVQICHVSFFLYTQLCITI